MKRKCGYVPAEPGKAVTPTPLDPGAAGQDLGQCGRQQSPANGNALGSGPLLQKINWHVGGKDRISFLVLRTSRTTKFQDSTRCGGNLGSSLLNPKCSCFSLQNSALEVLGAVTMVTIANVN